MPDIKEFNICYHSLVLLSWYLLTYQQELHCWCKYQHSETANDTLILQWKYFKPCRIPWKSLGTPQGPASYTFITIALGLLWELDEIIDTKCLAGCLASYTIYLVTVIITCYCNPNKSRQSKSHFCVFCFSGFNHSGERDC